MYPRHIGPPSLFESLCGILWTSGDALTVNATRAAVERVMDEEVTLHTDHTVTGRTAECLQTAGQRGRERALTLKKIISLRY